MGINANVGGYTNIGNDLQVILTGPFFAPIPITNVMAFRWSQRVIPIEHTQMNGVPLYTDLPNGFEGSIDFDRGDGVFETTMMAIQQNWLFGNDPLAGMVTCYLANASLVKVFTFLDATIRMEQGGHWTGDDTTKCTIAFRASTLLAV